MALAGQAVMVNWLDVAPEDRPKYYAWHNREHLASVVTIPGFQRGRRHIAVSADRTFFTCYEVDDLNVLTGADYRARVNNPSATTKATSHVTRNAVRALANVKLSLGKTQGACVLTLRLDPQKGRESELETYLMREALPHVVEMPEMVGAHFFVADMPASTYVSKEREGRQTTVPNWMIMIEGITLEMLEPACAEYLSEAALQKHGAENIVKGTFRLQISSSKMPSWHP